MWVLVSNGNYVNSWSIPVDRNRNYEDGWKKMLGYQTNHDF